MRLIRWLSQRPWLYAVLVALALAIGDAAGRIRRVEALARLPGELVNPPAPDAASPTGYSLGRRTLIMSDDGEDGYQWIMQTQAMLAGGHWRIHHVDYDNAPAGRDVHWASPLHWWLAALAWLDHAVTGRPLGAAVEWAALRANPVLLVLLVVGLVPLVARRFGSTAAAVLALGLVAAYPFNVCFSADYPDHHGIIEACVMGTVLFLLAGGGGLVRGEAAAPADAGARWLPDSRGARRWFIASAVIGGIGMWMSAACEVPVLVGLGLGAVISGWLGRSQADGTAWRPEPTLWRLWGLVGGGVSLAAYLVEYFPSHLGLRLEVNHPLYALAWCGGGELLCRLSRMRGPRGWTFNRRDAWAALAAAAAVALAPVVILLTKDRSFLVADRFVWQLGTRFVSEGLSLPRLLARGGFSLLTVTQCLPLLFIVPPVWLLFRRNRGPVWRRLAALALAPALLFLLLTLKENRWWPLEIGLLFAALAPVFAALEREAGSRRLLLGLAAACGLVLLPGAVELVQSAVRPAAANLSDMRQLEERDIGQWLRVRRGRDPVVVASTPVVTNHLIYFGSCRGLGTLYWENTEGLRHAAAIFAAPTTEEAHALVRRFGVTHIVLLSWDSFVENFVRFYRKLPPDQPLPADVFVQRLRRGLVPPWLRPLPCPMPPIKGLEGQRALVFEVVPEQTVPEGVSHLVDYLLEMGDPQSAMPVASRLERYPSDLQAQVTLAYLQGQTGQAEAFGATLRRVLDDLPQAGALAVGDRVRLALVLAAAGQTALAREQLGGAMAQLDERTLRRLTPGSLRDLLRMTEALGVAFPDARLRQLALSLYPPMFRSPPGGGPPPTGP